VVLIAGGGGVLICFGSYGPCFIRYSKAGLSPVTIAPKRPMLPRVISGGAGARVGGRDGNEIIPAPLHRNNGLVAFIRPWSGWLMWIPTRSPNI